MNILKSKKKLLIFQEELSIYNLPLYEELSTRYNLVLAVGRRLNLEPIGFKVVVVPIHRIGGFFYTAGIRQYLQWSDISILTFNLRWINLYILLIIKDLFKCKILFWGIGVSASYTKKFDADKRLDFIRRIFLIRMDATIFYSQYPINKYKKMGVDSVKLFCANNTVRVNPTRILNHKRDSLLFIGTLYKEKGLEELINVYMLGNNKSLILPQLNIVGGGEVDYYKKKVAEYNLTKLIQFHGAVYNEDALEFIFSSSFACISPNQAGLSVLKSMGYGVPFITKNGALTGGEIFNIINNYNGVIYKQDSELYYIIINMLKNKNEYLRMGINAKKYYEKYATLEIMTNGFIEAINFTSNKIK